MGRIRVVPYVYRYLLPLAPTQTRNINEGSSFRKKKRENHAGARFRGRIIDEAKKMKVSESTKGEKRRGRRRRRRGLKEREGRGFECARTSCCRIDEMRTKENRGCRACAKSVRNETDRRVERSLPSFDAATLVSHASLFYFTGEESVRWGAHDERNTNKERARGQKRREKAVLPRNFYPTTTSRAKKNGGGRGGYVSRSWIVALPRSRLVKKITATMRLTFTSFRHFFLSFRKNPPNSKK